MMHDRFGWRRATTLTTLAASVLVSTVFGYEVWHLIDVPLIVCPGGPGYADIEMDISSLNMQQAAEPHVFTFFRTTEKRVTIKYRAVDSSQPQAKPIMQEEEKSITLSEVVIDRPPEPPAPPPSAPADPAPAPPPARRLEDIDEEWLEEDSESEDSDTDLDDDADVKEEVGQERKLSGRRRGGGSRRGSYSSPRRRAPRPSPRRRAPKPSTQTGSPRRRVSRRGATPGSTADTNRRRDAGNSWNTGDTTRRRANPATYRRRNVPAPPANSPRRRAQDLTGNRWGNNGNAGSYGYTNQNQMQQSYPGGYQTNSYGYTGGNAYQSNSGGKMLMAGAAGVAVGAGAMYMMSRYNSYGYGHGYGYGQGDCMYGSTWTGRCRDCYERYPQHMCQQQMALPENANRDDIMTDGFIPLDFVSPLILQVTAVQGEDFAPDRICPPAGWNPETGRGDDGAVWIPPENQDIFLTLTHLEGGQLAEALVKDTQNQEQFCDSSREQCYTSAGHTCSPMSTLVLGMLVLFTALRKKH
eukprot:gnl/TRDRNA2_/TRDRNA2_199843_c0_seq1.p1 gnl/TRDRNA2_/TRDRNA2_199843_c0~~gnl/TRDRNA2_/TRDRNA2_199843_c0_seq1.p1  ORF type:complete len:524 (-),score=79.20 gnl/TRDRNA2_/TRDRNA2_199843_c0_seq1:149-1720(-)